MQHWREGAIARIHFNRPQALNAIDTAVAAGFLRACEDIAADVGVRAVWLSGEGRAFMAGGDLAEMQRDPQPVAQALIAGMHGGLRLLATLDAPVVASVQGAVAGGGLGLTLGCDLVIAAEGTRFSMAYPQIGASCDCSTSWGLPRIVGLRKALELAFGHLKRLMRESLQNDLDTHFDAEAAGLQASAATEDFAEGVAAFLGKRTPRFRGC